MLFFSVIIVNYNYGRFLREAIDSALAQTWPHREIIVVDDGSADDSREIIRSYGDKVIPILKENGGQASAFNAGWRICKGDLILFLDADDKLFDNCLEVVAQKWDPACVKAHYRLEIRDANGTYRGLYPPEGTPLAQGDVLDQVLNKGSYSGPPCSGNVYSRALLEKLMPIAESEFRLSADANLHVRTAFYGPLVAVDHLLGVYRMHGNNAYFGLSMATPLPKLKFRLSLSDNYRKAYRHEAQLKGIPQPLPVWPIDMTLQRIKMLVLKLDPPQDRRDSESIARLGWELLAYCFPKKELTLREKISALAFVIVVTFMPVWFVHRLREALPTIKRFTHKPDAIIKPRR